MKDVVRGRWSACSLRVPTKEVKHDALFLRIASSKSQPPMVGLLMDVGRLCMYSVSEMFISDLGMSRGRG
jgi:hypothetical protein